MHGMKMGLDERMGEVVLRRLRHVERMEMGRMSI